MATEIGEEIDAGGGVQSVDSTTLSKLVSAEFDIQISTARRYPRSIALAKKRMLDMATLDQETAISCGYALKRWDSKERQFKFIRGPSIRMAEIAAAAFGNLRSGSRIVDIGDKFVVAQGVCHDLETNNSVTKEVHRRITTKEGKRFGDDMIGVTANAAASIAHRNAVLTVVPRAIIKPVYDAAMKVAEGDEKTFGKRREEAIIYAKQRGVSLEEIMSVLDKDGKGTEDITSEDLLNLRQVWIAINDGEVTKERAFHPQKDETKTNATDDANAKLKAEQELQAALKDLEEVEKRNAANKAPRGAARVLDDQAGNVSDAGAVSSSIAAPAAPSAQEENQAANSDMENACGAAWLDFLDACVSVALKSPGSPFVNGPEPVRKAIAAHVLILGKKGAESKITQDGRRRIYTALAAGKMDVTGKISN